MSPDEALKTLEDDQKWDGEPVYFFSEKVDEVRYFVVQDGALLHEWTMEYQETYTVPSSDEL